jgi:hypothetical protein
MLKNITLSAQENLILKARERAATENSTLNTEFRRWLEKYALSLKSSDQLTDLMARFDYVQPGQKFSRDELNER